MPYDAGLDPYLDPSTGILKNLLGIVSQDELNKAEADISYAVLIGLSDNPIPGNFDLPHFQAVHQALFRSLYDWAGELRTVELSKGSTRFAHVPYIADSARHLFERLHSENLLRDLNEQPFIERLAHYYSEINILHPFREGNGRTQRAFFTLLAKATGHRIKWEELDQTENLHASIAAYGGDESKLVAMFTTLIAVDD